ncbi:MAG: methylmalonyl-CoA carboxyltransferase [Euryarchaeota archaeon]|nr:methylmalonyl-CoA carboxyltransferase [Euryarchaeota archaeon]
MAERLAELHRRREEALRAGGVEAVKRQHEAGKGTARERVEKMMDPGSFVETYLFVDHQGTEFGMPQKKAPADGVVTGYGRVDGRPVFVAAQDFTVMGGSLGMVHSKKICDTMDMAAKVGAPFVALCDSAGARVQEGVEGLSGYGNIFYRNTLYSGVVPQVSAIMGPCAGGAVYSPAITDFTLMVDRTAQMFITGPAVIKSVTGEEVTMEDLGGARVHATVSGNCDFFARDEEECIALIRELLGYLPSNNLDDPPVVETGDDPGRMDPELSRLVPADAKKAYDMREVIRRIVDGGAMLEVKEGFAPNILTILARLGGRSVGIIANQPLASAGVLDVNASDKAARFIRTCDAFSIPLLNLVDVPGYMPGVAQEQMGIIRHGAKMLFAYSEATVPKITVVLRKAYGGAYIAMCSKDLGADQVFAWPTAEIAVMGPEGAVDVVFKKEIQSSKEPAKMRQAKIEDYRARFANPYYAASRKHIDAVIEPPETRPRVIQALEVLRTKRETRPKKKHGNIPL